MTHNLDPERLIEIGGPIALVGFTLAAIATIALGVIRRLRGRRDEHAERCIACDEALVEGQEVYFDAGGGIIHAACCGPERESYTGADGEPLKDGEPIPTPWRWSAD